MIRSILVEGIDRVGKDTLIQQLGSSLDFHQVIHFQKPCVSDFYKGQSRLKSQTPERLYQEESFSQMFRMLSLPDCKFLMNRAHLGEVVYSQRYRHYDGSYVFDLESQFKATSDFSQSTLLVLLYTSDFDLIKDDGKSFDFTQKQGEQADFILAWERSCMEHKIRIDVSDTAGSFRAANQVALPIIEYLEDRRQS